MAHITLCAPLSPALAQFSLHERETSDVTWITDSSGFHFPLDIREHEILVVEPDTQDERNAFWREFGRSIAVQVLAGRDSQLT